MAKLPQEITTAISNVTTAVTELRSLEGDQFEAKVHAYADIGDGFEAIMAYELSSKGADDKAPTPNGVYAKYEGQLKKLFSRTPMVNHAWPIAKARANGELPQLIAKYHEVGMGKGVERNADGTVKLRVDLFGNCVQAHLDGRWNKGGSIRKVSGRGQTADERRKALQAKVDEYAATWEGDVFDLSQWTMDELKALKTALNAAIELVESS